MALNDRELNITFVNTAFRVHSAIPCKTFQLWLTVVKACLTLTTAEDYGTWQSTLKKHCRRVTSYPLEAIIHCRNAARKPSWQAPPMGHRFDGLHLVILIDISEQIETNRALGDAHTLLQSVIDTIPMRVFWKDRESRYLGCNTLFAEDGGKHTPLELLGKDDFSLAWKDQAALYRADDKAVMVSAFQELDSKNRKRPGWHEIWLRTSKVPLRNTTNEVIGILASTTTSPNSRPKRRSTSD